LTQTKKQKEALEKAQREFLGENLCDRCANFIGGNTCKAYPKGIPLEIVAGEVDCREVFRGDNGIRFEEKK
jgi:hypothetical protein